MNWQKQTDGPLFPDILWNQPENKRHAGKILIIGGHTQSFSAVSEAYSAANRAGIGAARVIIPNTLQRTLSKLFPEAEYAPSTNIGSFSRQALSTFLDSAEWADGVLLAGDFGKNSETAILLESLVDRYMGQITLAGDSVDYFLNYSAKLIQRPHTLLIANLFQIQKLAAPETLVLQQSELMQVVHQLSEWTSKNSLSIVTEHSGHAIAAHGGKASTTPVKDISLTNLAAYASVWYLQHRQQPFEALTTSVFYYYHQ